MKEFVYRYWGDLIALHLIYIGVIIVWRLGGNEHMARVGQSLIFSGAITLRMKGRDLPNEDHGPRLGT
jgi:hypothetical protein